MSLVARVLDSLWVRIVKLEVEEEYWLEKKVELSCLWVHQVQMSWQVLEWLLGKGRLVGVATGDLLSKH